MLYVDALCDGFTLTGIPPNPALRDELQRLGLDALRGRLLALDPDPGVDLKNPVRMIRAVEILEAAGPPLRALRTRTPPPWQALRIGLTAGLAMIDRRLEVYRRPGTDPAAEFGWRYLDVEVLAPGGSVAPLARRDTLIAVADLLP